MENYRIIKNYRLNYIDYAKGIGILLVVLGHIYSNSVSLWIYSFHMPLFFIISGFLLEHNKTYNRKFKDILISKLKSLVIPFYIYSIINTFVLLCLNNFSKEILIENSIRIITFQGKGGIWFLPCLFFAELLYISLRKNINNKFIINIIIGILFVISICLNTDKLALIIIARVFIALGFLCMGNLIVSDIEKYNINYVLMIFIFVISVLGSIFNGGVDLFSLILGRYKVLYVILSILGSVLIISICRKVESVELNKLKYFGVNSLIIMITHKSIINIIAHFVGIHNDYIYGTIIFITIMLIEIPVIHIINKYLPFTIGKFKKKQIISD